MRNTPSNSWNYLQCDKNTAVAVQVAGIVNASQCVYYACGTQTNVVTTRLGGYLTRRSCKPPSRCLPLQSEKRAGRRRFISRRAGRAERAGIATAPMRRKIGYRPVTSQTGDTEMLSVGLSISLRCLSSSSFIARHRWSDSNDGRDSFYYRHLEPQKPRFHCPASPKFTLLTLSSLSRRFRNLRRPLLSVYSTESTRFFADCREVANINWIFLLWFFVERLFCRPTYGVGLCVHMIFPLLAA